MRPMCLLVVVAVSLLTSRSLLADDAPMGEVETRFAALESELASDSQVRPAAYFLPPPQAPPNAYSEIVLPAPVATDAQGPVLAEPWPARPVRRSGRWLVGVDLIPTQFQFTDDRFGAWPDDGGFAMRLAVGYERPSGVGLRGRLWAYGEDATPPAVDVTVAASSFTLEAYKRLKSREGELTLGAGVSGNALQFKMPDDTKSRFSGGGLTVFADGYLPLVRFERSEFGAVGRGRMSLASGKWEDNTGWLVQSTEHDTMNVFEAAFGLEFRRQFGRRLDKYWSISVTEEIQRWDSPWLGQYTHSAAGFDGVNIDFGFMW